MEINTESNCFVICQERGPKELRSWNLTSLYYGNELCSFPTRHGTVFLSLIPLCSSGTPNSIFLGLGDPVLCSLRPCTSYVLRACSPPSVCDYRFGRGFFPPPRLQTEEKELFSSPSQVSLALLIAQGSGRSCAPRTE